jgi:hypothetical protein
VETSLPVTHPCSSRICIPIAYSHRIRLAAAASHRTGRGRCGRGSTGDGASGAAAALRAGAGLSLIRPAAAASHGTRTARPRLCGWAARLRADNAVKLLGLGKAASRQPAPRSSRAGGSRGRKPGTSQQAEVVSYFLNCNIEYDVFMNHVCD